MMSVLPFGFGELDWDDWIRGLISAFVGGGASAVTSGAVVALKDPIHYALGSKDFMQLVSAVFLASGVMSGMFFLRNKPIPDKKVITTTVQTTTQGQAPPKVVETIKEVHAESVEPKE